jgi:hypothetical protein
MLHFGVGDLFVYRAHRGFGSLVREGVRHNEGVKCSLVRIGIGWAPITHFGIIHPQKGPEGSRTLLGLATLPDDVHFHGFSKYQGVQIQQCPCSSQPQADLVAAP